MRGRVTPTELVTLRSMLTAPQLELFGRMHPADQRHGLDVMAALREAGHRDPELLLAGLLHDAAKGRSVRLWHRIAWSLAERYGDWVLRVGRVLPGAERGFDRLRHHAERSAEMALAAGCSQRTADLIRHQAEPQDEAFGPALLLADQAN
jgi:hypothetical protein